MGKKRSRAKKVSKGIHTSVATKVQVPFIDRMANKVSAWQNGKNPWVSTHVEGQAVRRRANDLWGDPRKRYNIFGKVQAE